MSATSNQTLIDLVFLFHPQQLKNCCVAPPLANSDHCCVNLSVTHRCGTTTTSNKSQKTIWRYQHTDFDRAIDLLDDINWEEVLQGDADQMWTAWEEKFMSVMHQCIPTAKISMKSRVPWISRDITKAMHARNLSFRRMKKTGRLDHRNNYNKKTKQGCKHARECKAEILQKDKIQPKKLLESRKMPNKANIFHPYPEGL
jgi:hypothetical protein